MYSWVVPPTILGRLYQIREKTRVPARHSKGHELHPVSLFVEWSSRQLVKQGRARLPFVANGLFDHLTN